MALRLGEDSEEAYTGALLVAEFLLLVRSALGAK